VASDTAVSQVYLAERLAMRSAPMLSQQLRRAPAAMVKPGVSKPLRTYLKESNRNEIILSGIAP
jgi:hypothetical protein